MSVIHPARPDADADRLLSPDEAVNFLGRGIEKRTLANWRAQRRGPRAVRVGRSPAYPLREMRRYSRWLQAGGDIYKLSRILGHSSVAVTEAHYAHLLKEDLVAASQQVKIPVAPRTAGNVVRMPQEAGVGGRRA